MITGACKFTYNELLGSCGISHISSIRNVARNVRKTCVRYSQWEPRAERRSVCHKNSKPTSSSSKWMGVPLELIKW